MFFILNQNSISIRTSLHVLVKIVPTAKQLSNPEQRYRCNIPYHYDRNPSSCVGQPQGNNRLWKHHTYDPLRKQLTHGSGNNLSKV